MFGSYARCGGKLTLDIIPTWWGQHHALRMLFFSWSELIEKQYS